MDNAPLAFVHFSGSGSVSMVSTLSEGSSVEVGLVGREGFLGLSVLLGAPTTPLEGLVQVAGTALRMTAASFRAALVDIPGLLPVLLRYVDAFHVQVAQSAVCNAHHQIEPRLARWLLMTHDRADGDSFAMTQEFMSYMLGVQRPGVTIAVGALQRAGLVRHERGALHMLDRAGLPRGFDLRLRLSGLGLRMALMCADQFQARLSAEPRPPAGARFTLDLPRGMGAP